jgi:hypothetical protein
MSRPTHLSPLFRMISLRELFDLLTLLRDFREPLSTPEGLHRAIDVLLKLGQSLGLDPALLTKLRTIADDPHVFEILLAVVRFALSFVNQPQTTIAQDPTNASTQSLNVTDWFALLMQLLELVRRMRR